MKGNERCKNSDYQSAEQTVYEDKAGPPVGGEGRVSIFCFLNLTVSGLAPVWCTAKFSVNTSEESMILKFLMQLRRNFLWLKSHSCNVGD